MLSNMVRFTVKDNRISTSIRMEMAPTESMREVSETASEYWGSERFLIRNGYRLLDCDSKLGDGVRDGDVLELIPDPTEFRF